MPELPVLVLFVSVALGILLAPGPAVTYVVARSLAQGTRAGLVSQVGLCAGLLVHVGASALGVSAAVARWPVGLELLKFLGAAYLAWLGWRQLRSPTGNNGEEPGHVSRSGRRLFWEGFLIDAVNPKPMLFFVSFLPQFVDPASSRVGAQIGLLGLVFVGLAFVTGAGYAALAGRASRRLRIGDGRIARSLSAAVLFGLAAAAVLDE